MLCFNLPDVRLRVQRNTSAGKSMLSKSVSGTSLRGESEISHARQSPFFLTMNPKRSDSHNQQTERRIPNCCTRIIGMLQVPCFTCSPFHQLWMLQKQASDKGTPLLKPGWVPLDTRVANHPLPAFSLLEIGTGSEAFVSEESTHSL